MATAPTLLQIAPFSDPEVVAHCVNQWKEVLPQLDRTELLTMLGDAHKLAMHAHFGLRHSSVALNIANRQTQHNAARRIVTFDEVVELMQIAKRLMAFAMPIDGMCATFYVHVRLFLPPPDVCVSRSNMSPEKIMQWMMVITQSYLTSVNMLVESLQSGDGTDERANGLQPFNVQQRMVRWVARLRMMAQNQAMIASLYVSPVSVALQSAEYYRQMLSEGGGADDDDDVEDDEEDEDERKVKKDQKWKLVRDILVTASMLGLRVGDDGTVFSQKHVSLDGRCVPTLYWEPSREYPTIRDFFQFCVGYDLDPVRHAMAIDTGVWDALAKRLCEGMGTTQFPKLVYDSRFVSFNNGIYDIATSRVWPYCAMYDDGDHPLLPTGLDAFGSTFLYIDSQIDPTFVKTVLDECETAVDVMHMIPTPNFDRISAHQQFSTEVQKTLYVMLGRLFFPIGVDPNAKDPEMQGDNWQVAMFLYGLAETGKSTLCQIVSKMLPPNMVTSFQDNTEGTFGLEEACRHRLCIAAEVTKRFLPRWLVQMMIAGDVINIPRKHKTPLTMQWTVPLLMAGNEFPQWDEGMGAVPRRIVMFDFRYKIPAENIDLELLNRILTQELGMIMVKLNLMYRFERDRIKALDGSFRTHLPEYFKRTFAMVARHTNMLLRFIDDCAEIEKHPNGFMLERDFVKHFQTFISHVGCKSSSDFSDAVLQQADVRKVLRSVLVKAVYENGEVTASEKTMPGNYYIGLRTLRSGPDTHFDNLLTDACRDDIVSGHLEAYKITESNKRRRTADTY